MSEHAHGDEWGITEKEIAAALEPVPMEATFEGSVVSRIEARLPAVAVEMDQGFLRGTHLRLMVEVRVKSVRHEELRNGDLVRQHVLALEGVSLQSAFRSEEVNDTLGGSASTNATPSAQDSADLGLMFGRSSDLWP